jgi:hypothetical protein
MIPLVKIQLKGWRSIEVGCAGIAHTGSLILNPALRDHKVEEVHG